MRPRPNSTDVQPHDNGYSRDGDPYAYDGSNVALPNIFELLERDRNRVALAYAFYQAAPDEKSAKSYYEGRNICVGYKRALQCAYQSADHNSRRKRGDKAPAEPRQTDCGNASGESYYRADRKINLPRNDDHQHPDRKHARYSRLPHEVREVARCEKNSAGGPGE